MKITKNANDIIALAAKLAVNNSSSCIDVRYLAFALLKTKAIEDVIKTYTSDEDFDDVMRESEDKLPAGTSAGIISFDKMHKATDFIMSLEQAANIANNYWITGNIEVSHIFLAVASSPFDDVPLVAFFEDDDELLNEVFIHLGKLEAKHYGIPFKVQKKKASIESLADMKKETDWHDYVTDLTKASAGYKKPFVGREDVIEDTIRTLARMDKCNPVHIGEPGVGKTAVTKGLAKRIADGNVPSVLAGSTLYQLDLAGLLAGTQYRGDFEARLKAVIKGIKEEAEKPILFIDEIHMIVGAGATGNGAMDASNILKPELTEGNIRVIGATTFNEYKQYIEKDKALERRFQPIKVEEPSIKDAIAIITGLKEAYEKYHNVSYTISSIKSAVELSAKYINDRYLPDKAIDLIDEAGATHSIHPELGKRITISDIETVLSRVCNIPKVTTVRDDMDAVKDLDKKLEEKVFGQDTAITAITDAIKLSKAGLADTDKPVGSFLLVGPSGVGKTEVAKQLAANLKINFIRFDMSEYQEPHTVAKLIGAPAGYIGYDDGGILTEAVRKTPHCVLLFDEIEKAHPDIYKTFLQIMDYGMLTDNKGRKADFRNAIIIMTSNAGATVVAKKSLGFNNSTESINVSGINDAVNEIFAPEFRNRLTGIITFNSIDDKIGRLVVQKELKSLGEKLKTKKINAKYTDKCIDQLVKLGVSPVYGARGIQRTVDDKIKKLFVEAIINSQALSKCIVDYSEETGFSIKAK